MKTHFYIICLMTLFCMLAPAQEQHSLSKALLHSTIRIVCLSTNGNVEIGTGFFYEFSSLSNASMSIPVIVTCKHVIANASVGMLDFALTQTNSRNRIQPHFPVTITNFESRWIEHPATNVDIAILPIASLFHEFDGDSKQLDFMPFNSKELIGTNDSVDAFQNVRFIGYPIGISDETNNLPIARQGMTATDASIDYEGRKEFLIDASVYPGSSGSPVLIADEGAFTTTQGIALGTRLRLLGIIYAVTTYDDRGHIEFRNIPTALMAEPVTSIPSNLGLVIKAEVLNDFKPILSRITKMDLQ